MNNRLHILHLEDNDGDAELISSMLASGGLDCRIHRVSAKEEFVQALGDGSIDMILSDFTLPSFDGGAALRMASERVPGIPFIFVSGTIGEEAAIQSLVGGATDYVLKRRIERLVPAVRRAMQEILARRKADEAERALRESEQMFRMISENVEDLIAVLDLRGRRVYNSPSYRSILGDPSLLRGSDSFDVIDPEDRENVKEIFRKTVETGIGHRTEFRIRAANGRTRYIESQGSVIRGSDGKVSNVIVVSRDVTDKKTLEQQLLRAQRLESLGTLAGGIAHDLNNVLAPILLSIELLKKSVAGPEAQKTLKTLEQSAGRGRDIIKQVLTFARGIAGERGLLQVRHIVTETLAIVGQTFPPSIEGQFDLSHDNWAVDGDATQIYQLLMNLCVNARDAMPGGGTLRVSVRNVEVDAGDAGMIMGAREGKFVLVTVEDTGTGMSPEILDRMFDPFFTTKEIGKGTGLGLSTVHTIVRNHGGFIQVRSEPGKGTSFRIYFPASGEDAAGVPLETARDLAGGKGELILLIDDEASICEITKQTLDAFGYATLTAINGADGIALFSSRPGEVALVITDMMMPGIDGPGTIRALRAISPSLKIIGSSGLISGDTVEGTGGDLPDCYITKPYTAEALLTSVNAALRPAVMPRVPV